MSTLYTIAISIVTLAACLGTGRLLSRLWRSKSDTPSERLLVDTTLGAGALSLVIFTLGTLQLYTPPALIAIFAIPTLALVASVARPHNPSRYLTWRATDAVIERQPTPSPLRERAGVRVKGRNRTLRLRFAGIPSALCALLLTLLAIATIIPALAPPAMSDWDSLAYHLAVPKLYLQHGGIYNIGIMSHSSFPFLMEMLYIPAVKLGLPEAARLLNFFVGVLLIACVWLLTKRHFDAKAAPTAALGLAGMPIVLFLATTAYIDLATALFTILSIHLLLNYLDTRERPCLVGCAIAAGFAASTKMTGLVTIPLIAIWLLADHFAAGRRLAWKPALAFICLALAVCSPWYIKTFIYTGNPVYPFFYGLLGGRGWSADLASQYTTQQSIFGMGHDITAFLLLPWNLAFASYAFYDHPGLYVGPIFVIAVPLLFAAKYQSRKLIGLLGFFVAYVAIWFGLTHQSRYLIPGFAVLAVLVSAVAHQDDRFRLARRALAVVFAATAVFGIYTLWPAITRSAPVVFGHESREAYLSHAMDTYSAVQLINSSLPANARIALMGDTRGYYLDRSYVWADPGHSVAFTRHYTSAEDFAGYLKSKGITHVLINFRFFAKRGAGTEPYYSAIDKGLLTQVYPADSEHGPVAVYELK